MPSFRSFLQAGFECSSHKRPDGRRLDLLASTGHDRFALEDYRRIQQFGIRTARTAARWHRIEIEPGRFDFSSLLPTLTAAQSTGTEVLLDLLHFGWPDHIDIFGSSFQEAFSAYVRALLRWLLPWRDTVTAFAPVNEISFFAWAGADVGAINPATIGRGDELKRILVRAALAASEVIRQEWDSPLLLFPEPVIHIVGNPDRAPGDEHAAAEYSAAQYQAWDMLAGRLCPELGGFPEALDVIGVNFYARNQWVNYGRTLPRNDPQFRPFRLMLQEVWERYGRPIFVSETGTEDDDRAGWFTYVCDEVQAAKEARIPILGICLYPILNVPGWADDRHIHSGLFDYADAHGNREIYAPLAEVVHLQQSRFSAQRS